MKDWTVTVNGDWTVIVEADTASDALSTAGDRWRALFTEGEDRGGIQDIEARPFKP